MERNGTNYECKHAEAIKSLFNMDSIDDNELYYLDTLYCAIENIEESEIRSTTPYSEGEEEESMELHISNELLCKYRDFVKRENPLQLRVGLEIRKHVSEDAEKVLTKYDVQPDFVVHNSNKDFNCQLIAGEVKRQSALTIDNFAHDINKLLIYNDEKIWGGHPFIYPLYIVFLSNKDKFSETIENFIKNDKLIEFKGTDASISQNTIKQYLSEHEEDIKRIICFFYQKENKVSVYTLYDILYSI